MQQGLFYLASSFWAGAVHAATPGHGKTIAAAYIVGARGRPVDALVLGIFVTLSHTSGIVLVAVLASLGSAWLIPHRIEAYLALLTGMLVIGIGVWLLVSQRVAHSAMRGAHPHDSAEGGHEHSHATGAQGQDRGHQHAQAGDVDLGYHSHGWGRRHTHRIEVIVGSRPKLAVLLGLG